jgi:hypothetical protein
VNKTEYEGLNLFQSIKNFYQTQGMTGLFKGNSASLARIFPFSAMEFYSFEFYKNIFMRGEGNKKRQNSIIYTKLCGSPNWLECNNPKFPVDCCSN